MGWPCMTILVSQMKGFMSFSTSHQTRVSREKCVVAGENLQRVRILLLLLQYLSSKKLGVVQAYDWLCCQSKQNTYLIHVSAHRCSDAF